MGPYTCVSFLLVVSVVLQCFDSTCGGIFYRNHTLKQWCDPNPLLKVVRRIINQPNDLFLTRENALQITHRWESTFYDECVFTVESQQGSGLILNVNQMYFRSDPRDPLNECIDYFRIKYYNGTKSQRMCGRLNATVTSSSTMALRSFVVPDGRVEIKIRIDENRKLSPREHLYVDFLFTQYDDCRPQPNSFTCSDQICIHQKYANDGNINCPYPRCTDETSCQNKTIVIPQVGNSKRAIIGGIAAAVVLAVLVPITICCCCEFCRKGAVSRGHNRNRHPHGSSSNSSGGGGSSSSGGGRRHRHRSNRSASRGTGRHTDHLRGDEATTRQQSVGFTAIVGSSPPPPLDDQKESPPPTYESLFPGR